MQPKESEVMERAGGRMQQATRRRMVNGAASEARQEERERVRGAREELGSAHKDMGASAACAELPPEDRLCLARATRAQQAPPALSKPETLNLLDGGGGRGRGRRGL